MEKRAYVFLADGFEEVAGLVQVDLLRRAGIDVKMVSVTGNKKVCGSHQIQVTADATFEQMALSLEQADLLILPGGMPGTLGLRNHNGLETLLKKYYKKKKYIAAICAAPGVFGAFGFLEGRKACIYPGMEDDLRGAEVSFEPVVKDAFIITGRGVGTAIPFALELIRVLCGKEKADQIADSIVYER